MGEDLLMYCVLKQFNFHLMDALKCFGNSRLW